MKKALSLLVAFMFLQTQMWALSGGPVYTNKATSDLTGGFTGAFVAKSTTAGPGLVFNPVPQTGMGVFSLLVPVQGPATGTTVFFQGNVTYTGTITGAANSANRTITGIIQATSTSLFTVSLAILAQAAQPAVFNPGPVPPAGTVLITPAIPAVAAQPAITTALFAQGSMQAKVSGSKARNTGNEAVDGVARSGNSFGGVDANGNPIALGQVGDRLSGTATIVGQFQNTARLGPPNVAETTIYSISGVRQTNAVASAAPAP